MAKLSRYEKYKDLRAQLHSDTGSSNIGSQDLSEFANRLNKIDSDNFAAPKNYSNDSYTASHAKTMERPKVAETREPLHRTQSIKMNSLYDTGSYAKNENDDSDSFDHDYLDQYIREVKQYNIDQGNASSENTQMNILQQIHGDTKEESKTMKTLTKPFVEQDPDDYDTSDMDIPFFANRKESKSANNLSLQETMPLNRDYSNTHNMHVGNTSSHPIMQDNIPSGQDTRTQSMTREDIMAEVQNMVNGTNNQPLYQVPPLDDSNNDSPFMSDSSTPLENNVSTDTFNRHIEDDRTTRQQLLNETSQMRAQLDDYEDNLSEVTNKMRHTNRILNIVLIVLIIALAVILGVVIYWIIISR